MAVQITIRGVPERTRDRLKVRAALKGQSMQAFLRCELERIAFQPSTEEWLEEVREHKRIFGSRIPRSAILDARDADRK